MRDQEPGETGPLPGCPGRALARLGDPRFDPDRWYLPKEPLLGFVPILRGRS